VRFDPALGFSFGVAPARVSGQERLAKELVMTAAAPSRASMRSGQCWADFPASRDSSLLPCQHRRSEIRPPGARFCRPSPSALATKSSGVFRETATGSDDKRPQRANVLTLAESTKSTLVTEHQPMGRRRRTLSRPSTICTAGSQRPGARAGGRRQAKHRSPARNRRRLTLRPSTKSAIALPNGPAACEVHSPVQSTELVPRS